MKMKINGQGSYELCSATVLSHVNQSCVQFVAGGQKIWIRGNRDELRMQLEMLLEHLQPNKPTTLENRVAKITPQEVVQYFHQSPILAEMAGDVEAVLGKLIAPTKPQNDLDLVHEKIDPSDLFNNGKIIRGAQTRVAEALGISNGGQSNRKRINYVLDRLVEFYSTNSTQVERVRNAA